MFVGCAVLTSVLLCVIAGHVHITDFNIATIVKGSEKASSMAGTKPYMGKFSRQFQKYKKICTLMLTNGILKEFSVVKIYSKSDWLLLLFVC